MLLVEPMLQTDAKGIITLIGIVATFVVSCASLALSVRNSKRSDFISAVTKSRLAWIEALRASIAAFCSKVNSMKLDANEETSEKQHDLIEEIMRLKHFIILHLDREDEHDAEVMKMIGKLSNVKKIEGFDRDKEIKALIKKTQDLLNLEWQGIKAESKKGNLSPKHKKELYEKHLG